MIRKIINKIKPKPKTIPITIGFTSNQTLCGKTAIVSGGTSGIGYEIAKSFVNAGANVTICIINNTKLE